VCSLSNCILLSYSLKCCLCEVIPLPNWNHVWYIYPHLHCRSLQIYRCEKWNLQHEHIITYYCVLLRIYSMNLTDSVTSPEPRNWQSTWDIRQQPLRWCLHLQGRSCSDGRHFDSRHDGWTGWSPYLLPKLQAVFLGSRWLAKRTQPPSPEGSRIWVWSSTWWSTTLLNEKQGRSNFKITHYYMLWHFIMYQRVPAWSHSRMRRRRIKCQLVLHVHVSCLTWWYISSFHCIDILKMVGGLTGRFCGPPKKNLGFREQLPGF
jgi:hypothetical protein